MTVGPSRCHPRRRRRQILSLGQRGAGVPPERASHQRSVGGVNTKIECLERMAYGFSNRPNYEARCSSSAPAIQHR